MSVNGKGGYFHFVSFYFQIFKTILVFCLMLGITVLNKNNINKIVKLTISATAIITVICIVDNYFIMFSGNPLFYRLWWYSIIHIANAGVFIGMLKCKAKEKEISAFFKGYTPFYLFTFAVCFLRPFGDTLTTNFRIGHGTILFLNYLIHNPKDSEIWFNFLGNILIFLPLPFILISFFNKIKTYQLIFVGAMFPIFAEGYQYIFKCGDVDIDDVILNFAGFLIGLFLLKAIPKIIKKISDKKRLS